MHSNVAGRQGRGQHNALQGKAGLGKAAAQRAPLAPQLKGYALEDVPAERPAPQRSALAAHNSAPAAAAAAPAHSRKLPLAAHSGAPAPAAAAPAAAAAAPAPRRKLQPAPRAVEAHHEPPRASAVAPAGPALPRAPAAADAREAAAPAGRSSGARRERDKRRSKQKLAAARGAVVPAGLPGAEGPVRGRAAMGGRARGAPLGRPPAERTEEGARVLAVRGVQRLSHDEAHAAPPHPPASRQPGADECVRWTGDGGSQASGEAPADVLAAVLASRRRDAALGDAAAERDAGPARAAAEARPIEDSDPQARGAAQRGACVVPALFQVCEGAVRGKA